ncbi:MAG TPA: hypothetical protein VEL28_21465 [Candidatus Binatia bacterium]|nr:hypothetical protein [Candidatus Binatia bacterium]
MKLFRAAAAAALGCIAIAPQPAWSHATYNVTGYGAGVGGSANGADGALPPTWTNGPVEYVGSLPVQWYLGMHANPGVRIIQSGAGVAPPSGSLLAQLNEYNVLNEPDLATDRVLAVGGKSWSDPENDNQGWGHGLDYGIVHITPLETILADGPVKMTITLQDDPSDAVSPRLAFALYSGWDTGSSSVRHQTFVTSPAPLASNPLGSTGLSLIDYVVSPAPGIAVSLTLDLDAEHLGQYTIFVGAQGGVTGQYMLSLSLESDDSLATCEAALADTDQDGVLDAFDDCDTGDALEVDASGCSREEFCASFDANTLLGKKGCVRADWKNDQSVLPKRLERDCKVLAEGGPEPENITRTCIARP